MTSVLDTQEAMLSLEREKRELEARLEQVKADLAVAVANHRAQIAKSLTSKDSVEREMAEGVRAWYEVPPAT
jgi:hypothetical protein